MEKPCIKCNFTTKSSVPKPACFRAEGRCEEWKDYEQSAISQIIEENPAIKQWCDQQITKDFPELEKTVSEVDNAVSAVEEEDYYKMNHGYRSSIVDNHDYISLKNFLASEKEQFNHNKRDKILDKKLKQLQNIADTYDEEDREMIIDIFRLMLDNPIKDINDPKQIYAELRRFIRVLKIIVEK